MTWCSLGPHKRKTTGTYSSHVQGDHKVASYNLDSRLVQSGHVEEGIEALALRNFILTRSWSCGCFYRKETYKKWAKVI